MPVGWLASHFIRPPFAPPPLRRCPLFPKVACTVSPRSHRGDRRNGAVAKCKCKVRVRVAGAGLFIPPRSIVSNGRSGKLTLVCLLVRLGGRPTPKSLSPHILNGICHTHGDRLGSYDARIIHYTLYSLYSAKVLAERYRYIATVLRVR